MRTTITLEPDVAALVERDMRQRGVTFKVAVNDAIRRTLGDRPRADFSFPTFDLGPATYDLTRSTQLAAALEDEEIVRDLQVGK
jgi:hypothetical protein